MQIQSLGHVVLQVRNQQRAEEFYNGVLGLSICARNEDPRMTFFTLGNHHDFAIAEVGEDAETPPNSSVGLAHVAFKIGESLDELRKAKADLEAVGVGVRPIDHEVTQSLYFRDPDGNTIEVYVDVSDAWKKEPQRVAQGAPLEL
ncbi:MAG: VOC family protein [Pseudomonadales bacterium]